MKTIMLAEESVRYNSFVSQSTGSKEKRGAKVTTTVLVLPFTLDEFNNQRFLHREAELPQPLPDSLFLGTLPTEQSQVLEWVPRIFTKVATPNSFRSAVLLDVKSDIHYVLLEEVGEHEKCIPFLLAQGWSEDPLPDWLIGSIRKPLSDPYQSHDM